MSGAGHFRFWVLLVGVGLIQASELAYARYVPLQTTSAGLAARVEEVADSVRDIGPSIGVTGAHVAGLSACAAIQDRIDAGDATALRRCATALGDVYGELWAAEPTDPRRRGVGWFVAWGVADAALRLTAARSVIEAGDPGRLAPPGRVASQVLVHGDGRTLRIRPLRALRPGRRWALVVEGLEPTELAALRETVVPKMGEAGLEVPAGSFSGPVVFGMRDDPSEMDHERAIALAKQLEQDIRGRTGTSPVAGVQVRLPAPLSSADLERIVATFVPAHDAPAEETVVVLPVLDLRSSLGGYVDRLTSEPCVSAPARSRAGILPSPALVLEGTYPSLEIGRESDGRRVEVGVVDATDMALPYLLALPPEVGPATPLVVAVHGHSGTAADFLSVHGAALLARGLAVLAVEYPDHGERGAAEKEFLGVLDPVRLGVNYRQSVVDVLAAIHSATACGFALEDGTTYRPSDLRYLGYSLGSLVGITVRSLWPSLGPAVFVAAAGDLAGWLMMHFPNYLDAPVLTCVGGPQDGESCFDSRVCSGPGVCWIDPYFARMAFLFDLPFGLVLADAEPLGPSRVRTGAVSHAPALLLTAGEDGVLFSLLQARLGDAYDLHGEPPGRIRGPRSERRHWPSLGHNLIDNAEVRAAAYDFLATPRRVPSLAPANPAVDKKQAGG
ncbi:MAG: hypothetical protein P8R42_22895 [Candidatus Binatia bacterium]|nr:hypothetical protein [Candidatus Binatia bacterium]